MGAKEKAFDKIVCDFGEWMTEQLWSADVAKTPDASNLLRMMTRIETIVIDALDEIVAEEKAVEENANKIGFDTSAE